MIRAAREKNITLDFSATLFQQVPQLGKIVSELAVAASIIHQQGWAEANAGNVSIRITKHLKAWLMSCCIDDAAEDWFLVSRSGSRYRELATDPLQNLMLVCTGSQDSYYPATARPTSEWICHKMIHDLDSKGAFPCLLHTHPTELIALSHTAIFNDEQTLNIQLSDLLPELPDYLPRGVACSSYALPGSQELAELSALCFGDKQALIWQKHGLLCRAASVNQALDYLEIINKAAKLYFLCKA